MQCRFPAAKTQASVCMLPTHRPMPLCRQQRSRHGWRASPARPRWALLGAPRTLAPHGGFYVAWCKSSPSDDGATATLARPQNNGERSARCCYIVRPGKRAEKWSETMCGFEAARTERLRYPVGQLHPNLRRMKHVQVVCRGASHPRERIEHAKVPWCQGR